MDLFDIAVAKKFAGGGGRDTLVVGMDMETYTLDKTWNEINDAFPNVYISLDVDGHTIKCQIITLVNDGNIYKVIVSLSTDGLVAFITNSADGYPSVNAGGSGGSDTPSS